MTTLGVGGSARRFVRAATEAELAEALAWATARGEATFILGGGSNLVIADDGIDALVIAVGLRGISVHPGADGRTTMRVAAGEPWDDVVARAADENLAGIECLSGIPGLTGATPIQNVGAYGQEVADVITRVSVVERATGARSDLDPEACAFSYRDSAFKRGWAGRFVVTSIDLSLRAGAPDEPRYAELARAMASEPKTIAATRAKVIELRVAKAMVHGRGGSDNQSAGSFFMNPIVPVELASRVEERAKAIGALAATDSMPRFAASSGTVKLAAGWLIERAGFKKGTARDTVGLSSKHALAIVNRGGATANDVVSFARWIRDGVEERFGVRLVPEPELVGFRSQDIADLRPQASSPHKTTTPAA
ncbi:MAG: UDP-N-acetylmuramate dehydrogenase [Polyangiaceae bacterium]|nr:UDP-N-acetylmuramate dehydrogenase [Polyangiaceae bacterium]